MAVGKIDNPFLIRGKEINFAVVKEDYVEFSGEDEKSVTTNIENSLQNSGKIWEETVKTFSNQEIEKFYLASNYIYEIMLAYLIPDKFGKKKTCIDIVEFIKRVPGNNVMEYGGGTGQLSLLIYFNTGKNVTYVDLPSKVMDFAKWRFNRYKAAISCVEARIEKFDLGMSLYDCIVSDAVLEHVTDLEGTINSISTSLRNEGTFYLLFDNEYSKDFPMHISAKKNVEKIMRENGLLKIDRNIYLKSRRLSVKIKYLFVLFRLDHGLIVYAVKHPKKAIKYYFPKAF